MWDIYCNKDKYECKETGDNIINIKIEKIF